MVPRSNRKPKPIRFKSKSSRRRQSVRPRGEHQARLPKCEPGLSLPGPDVPRPYSELPTSSGVLGKASPPGRGAEEKDPPQELPSPVRPLRVPTLAAGALTPIHPGRAQGAAEVSEGRAKLRARRRLPLAASAGSSVRQSKGARSLGMPARPLPAARAAASCGGRRGSDVYAHHRRSRGRPPTAALSFLAGGRRWALRVSPALLGTPGRSFTALAPALSARALRPTPLRSLPRPRH